MLIAYPWIPPGVLLDAMLIVNLVESMLLLLLVGVILP